METKKQDIDFSLMLDAATKAVEAMEEIAKQITKISIEAIEKINKAAEDLSLHK